VDEEPRIRNNLPTDLQLIAVLWWLLGDVEMKLTIDEVVGVKPQPRQGFILSAIGLQFTLGCLNATTAFGLDIFPVLLLVGLQVISMSCVM
jgi:hypothetical protein